ncbi:hypothetical protein AWJ20_4174 [Sugiyamaella lignohabitans]|uniref:Heme-degrading domain-containing protein n=1 Tax=Sugiyamaella lignohabitans TaxID=796027 RepID=A0A161HJ55_9ASCO|nr:uncharacterized protein AWJ20_4174 [Sugiyamaella lignohabitans]ANB11368.1 hypothetical protein AWJ20_4174 [Sugiyamaella lignohabitans]
MSSEELLNQLRQHEKDAVLPAFNSDIAWQLGQIVRKNSLKFDKSVIISITGPNGLVLFQTTTGPGVTLDNQSWVNRKRRAVTYFEQASYLTGRTFALNGKTMADFGQPTADFATHGGGFPIRVKGLEGLAGVIVVSGLKQEDDHALAYNSIIELLNSLK